MGGQYQAAAIYVLSQMIDFSLSPQEALDLPRVFQINVLDFEKILTIQLLKTWSQEDMKLIILSRQLVVAK